ncbi:LA_2272 family surface repeat-containing protein [Coraliomargarita akajimensis]|uniref:Secreted protein n=1 Tax=Coraliomargarita akajimensis (strain DSM 45221 / IAM 15411 / JCM 23193 / KCTC 12865 / 04OKA010-24) TaxID=583355 RepID=D5EJG3_CORAD|nr:hypothetical protein [Coraliomargarita akajimensis]ADE54562.1 conserved hypothetical protein [Coraliomargarita akajimensis DSM 45221]
MKKLILTLVAGALAASTYVSAAGFQASLTPEIAIHDRNTEINGVSIGVWNENPGGQWQAGFVNGATGDSYGLQSFIFLPTFYNYADNYKGVQMAFVNWTKEDFVGVQLGFVNIANNMKGFQWGTVNYCETLNGLQLGLVNWAERSTSGVQIGLANFIPENEWFSDGDLGKGFIFVNWGF